MATTTQFMSLMTSPAAYQLKRLSVKPTYAVKEQLTQTEQLEQRKAYLETYMPNETFVIEDGEVARVWHPNVETIAAIQEDLSNSPTLSLEELFDLMDDVFDERDSA